ncbi:MAG TPA: type II secretion system protein [Burkholderiales bacterium]|nr:type II secretion system protein [Burkholderiales bacterium]
MCIRDAFRVRSSRLDLEPGIWNLERRKPLGLSLVEQIVFIVVVGAAVAGVLAALNLTARGSADPMIQKQALAIAEAVLEEIQLQPFTYCDPDDANAATALNPAGCATTPEAIGPEAGETRSSATTPFDNVNDYDGFTMTGMTDIAGAAVAGLDGYAVSVSVAGQALGAVPAAESLLITVTVTAPVANVSVALHGYRIRYAPNALP